MSPYELVPSSPNVSSCEAVTKHVNLSFKDGNIALLAGKHYFIVHQGLLCRHSPVLRTALEAIENTSNLISLEGRPVLEVQDSSEDISYFLIALYDGIPNLSFNAETYGIISALLRLTTKYQVQRLRNDLIQGLAITWPSNLATWDAREAAMFNYNGTYDPRKYTPHPMLVINLARSVNAPELLPSAFYDLSRSPISHTAAGYTAPGGTDYHHLSDEDLFNLLRGREDASRFLSTFIVNQLEGRKPSTNCIYMQVGDHTRRRFCQFAFENVFRDLLRATNSLVCDRSCDPLFAIMHAEMIYERGDGRVLRPCESCRAEFRVEVEAARDEFWHSLPEWFGDIQVTVWG
ncbi:hypothetical protein EV361DRAFT_929274 [Lentinula raphanica]|uniref:BTB domain-containing protein n=1 Tax=Lentinula raphanica TaxID=153919 RepID=A0AA38P800_9AGAR|nr:hypothetical protein C8R42DRAFT_577273 [Lentinula raphanica]KAJ3763571.1 hypothetical protein EV360DRAFT_91773 [Lentinula raphanica]KAJ3776289.1 hypothetical protein FB446DRAFT_721730 [Lentinula raphanica]KAJ3823708.1 hypothetical protein F5880DRAFT_1564960 [Lentinula raphanica]KAJ3838009.1 hypothetical protein F5878DRAFT_725631 [Lentinula raphanica]